MRRAVVSVASTEYYRRGQERLAAAVGVHGARARMVSWPAIPTQWPAHSDKPFAFKAYALHNVAIQAGADVVLWCDACMLPVRSLEPLWEKIERDGAVLFNNGWSNYEWTADSAYPDLFPEYHSALGEGCRYDPAQAKATNGIIPHVVGGCFGLNLRSELGQQFLREFYRLASETRAFCGPLANTNHPDHYPWTASKQAPCGPPDVRGHRHDQTALSVIAWRLGVKLTDPPEGLIYGKAEQATDERTVIVADGSYL